jgi:histidine ammonia-lyase
VRSLVLGLDPITTEVLASDAVAPWSVSLGPEVEPALRAAERDAAAASLGGAAYGRTTGVGANRDDPADDADGDHGLRLVRSHATGAGALLPDAVGRAAALARAGQLVAPGSGIPFEMVDGLVRSLNDGRAAPARSFGGVGTGDITTLAEVALCLLGERAWAGGARQRYVDRVDASAALSFMSSSAPTLAVAALAVSEAQVLVRASLAIAALGSLAVRANRQQWSEAAAGARPSAGVASVSSLLRSVTGGCRYDRTRTQDPLSFRCVPYVAGPALDALDELVDETDRCLAARAENPRFADGAVWHHGAFMLTSLSLRLDTARLALTQWCSTSLARLVKLHDPASTGQPRFLAHGPSGSSGTMVLEYTAASALETVRTLADPSSRHTVSISVGAEDHASFATRGALALRESLPAVATVLACELVAAVRAVRGATAVPSVSASASGRPDVELSAEALELLEVCASLPAGLDDRPLVEDVALAADALPRLAARVG